VFLLQLTASARDVIRSRDSSDHLVSATIGQFDTRQQVRAKIICDMLTSERDYVKLLRDIVEVTF